MKLTSINHTRTNNFTDPNMIEKIQKIWKDSADDLTRDAIVYGLYSNYESNYRGDYTLTVAVNSNDGDITIPDSDNYKIFIGNANDVVTIWKKIWSEEDKKLIDRKYDYDFEKYLPDGKVEIYISII